jgi:valyl-tRNA synthetase
MNEVIIDGVTYVATCKLSVCIFGDPSRLWDRFNGKKLEEIRRKMIARLVEDGYFERKEDYEKKHSIYGKDELFYGM